MVPWVRQFLCRGEAHQYNGTWDGLDRKLDGLYYGSSLPYINDSIQMAWSNSWLSNTDCNGDNYLDRGYGTGRSATNTSEGWLTNTMTGPGYSEYVKIIYIGPTPGALWGAYLVVQDTCNETGTSNWCGDSSYHLLDPAMAGLGLAG